MGKREQSDKTVDTLPPRRKSLRISRNELVRTSVRVEEDYGHGVFPNEVWEKIFDYLAKKDLRALTVVSRSIRAVALRRYWDTPSFRKPMCPTDLESLSHLPIGKLYTSDLVVKKIVERAELYVKVFEKIETLREVAVSCGGTLSVLNLDTLRILAPYVTSLNTGTVEKMGEQSSLQFVEELARIDFPKIQQVVLYSEFSYYSGKKFGKNELAILDAKFPIAEIHVNVLQCIRSHNRNWYYQDEQALLEMKNLNKIGYGFWWRWERFSNELMAKLQGKGIVFEKQDKMHHVRKYFSGGLYKC